MAGRAGMLDWSGAVAPSVFYRPPWLSSVGRAVVELAGSCGLFYDPWQCLALEEMLGRTTVLPWDPESRWAASESGLIIPRQNGKDSIIEGISLASLFLWRESFVHSAHQFKTTKKAFLRVRARILANPDLRRRLLQPIEGKGITTGVGNEGIHLAESMDNGDPVEGMYVARSGGSGRGFTVPRVIYNEAWELDEDAIAAQTPAQATFPDTQTIYVSSAPDQQKHENAKVLGELRGRAQSGDDPDLCWQEWSAAPDAAPGLLTPEAIGRRHDEVAYAQANPSFGIVRAAGAAGVGAAFLHRQARSPMGPRWFDVEHMGIGDWPQAGNLEPWKVVHKAVWADLGDPASEAVRGPQRIALGIEMAWNRSATCIGLVGRREDDRYHLEIPTEDVAGMLVLDYRAGSPDWVVPRVVDLVKRHRPVGVAINENGPAAPLIPDLEAAGVNVKKLTGRDLAAGYGLFTDNVRSDGLRHVVQQPLDRALGGAATRMVGTATMWDMKDATTDSCPVVAMTGALQMLHTAPKATQFFASYR